MYLKSGNYHRVFAAVVVRKLIGGGVNFALVHIIPRTVEDALMFIRC
jgi:hypothetical protein